MIEFIVNALATVLAFIIFFFGFKCLFSNRITKQRKEEIIKSREILSITQRTMIEEEKGNDSLDDMIRYHKENEVVHYKV